MKSSPKDAPVITPQKGYFKSGFWLQKVWKPLSAGLLLVLLSLLALRAFYPTPPMKALDVSMWYWHNPFRLSSEETRKLQTLGVRRLFVLAGTISVSGDGTTLMLPQTWQPSPGAPAVDRSAVMTPASSPSAVV